MLPVVVLLSTSTTPLLVSVVLRHIVRQYRVASREQKANRWRRRVRRLDGKERRSLELFPLQVVY